MPRSSQPARQTPRSTERITYPAPPTPAAVAERDELAVRAILAGDQDRFEELVRRHQKPIINFLQRMVGDYDLALDLSQDVFVRVYSSLHRYNPRYRFTTWLYRIASNCAIDHLRRRRPAVTSLDAPQMLADGEVLPQAPGNDPDPARRLEGRERLARLERSVRKLPAEYRELVLLRHCGHLSYEEMARVTRRPLGTVKNRLFRARDALRTLMEEEGC